ncbi:ice-binding family protein [Sideroxydans sp.]
MISTNFTSKPLTWFMAVLLAAFVAGCGGGGGILAPAETVAPSVSLTAPLTAATGVAINANITAIFSEAMDVATITTTTFSLSQGATAVPGAVTYSGTTAVFNPTGNLAVSTVYTATITTGAKDLAGNALAATKTWSFTTGTSADTTAPTVISTVPASGATSVAVGANIVATFSETMNAATITAASTFTLKQGSTVIPGVATFPGTTIATFNPTSDLTAGLVYTATITTAAEDLAGNALAVAKTWSFTAASVVGQVVCGGASGTNCVNLLSAANYVILDEATVTFTPIATTTTTATITGDIAVSPAAASFMTGFALALDPAKCFSTSTQVVGKLYAADYSSVNGCATATTDTATLLTTAVSDKNAAYNAALAKPASGGGLITACPGTGAMSDAGIGAPIAAGVYTCGVNVTIPGDLTLNGNATDVWVFQITGSLTQTAAKNVLLTGGALPQNVFWIVSNGVSVGAGAHMEGVVMSATNISLVTGATVTGRLFGRTGVLMDSNTVTQP